MKQKKIFSLLCLCITLLMSCGSFMIHVSAETGDTSKTGMSGAPIVLNSVVINNNDLTCDETVIGISRSGPSSRGCSIVRPILQFTYGNEILNNQVDIL